MKDIVERLRRGEHWPNAAADEIERLRADGQKAALDYLGQIGQLSDEIERLREWNAEIALNARTFAEVLREIASYEIEEGCPCNACKHSAIARAALGKEEA